LKIGVKNAFFDVKKFWCKKSSGVKTVFWPKKMRFSGVKKFWRKTNLA